MITRLPRNSLSVTFRPSVLGSANSGAIMPTVRLSPGQSGDPGLAEFRLRGGGVGNTTGFSANVLTVGSASNSRVLCMDRPAAPPATAGDGFTAFTATLPTRATAFAGLEAVRAVGLAGTGRSALFTGALARAGWGRDEAERATGRAAVTPRFADFDFAADAARPPFAGLLATRFLPPELFRDLDLPDLTDPLEARAEDFLAMRRLSPSVKGPRDPDLSGAS